MRRAAVKVFPPRQSRIVQAVPGQPNGMTTVGIDLKEIIEFITGVGRDDLIGVTMMGPMVQVWYWVPAPEPDPEAVDLEPTEDREEG